MRPFEKWKLPYLNHSANQNAGTTKMLPPSGKELHSPSQNVGFSDTTNTICNRTNDNAGFPDTQPPSGKERCTHPMRMQDFQTQ